MHVRAMLEQQPGPNPTTQRAGERPERRERPERPEPRERPELSERPESPDVRTTVTLDEQANQVIIRNGVPVPPVPPIPGIEVHTGGAEHLIPPQVVDLAYGAYAMLAVMVIGWPLARAWGRRLERSTHSPALSPAMGEQLQRIEQAVEAMALEVERISEAQRYVAKIQSARVGEPAALPSSERR